MRTLAKSIGFLLIVFLFVAFAYGIGLYAFASHLPRTPQSNVHADSIVALTGGDERMIAAVRLLEKGAGKRLLITGVHPEITKPELKTLTHGGKRFDCCADLDFAAEDTRGNAAETANWISTHHYRSLILVTANYHMPRSFVDFSAEMPGIAIVPYPVDPSGMDLGAWWRHPHTLRTLNVEYVKFLASVVLSKILPPADEHRTG